MPLASRTFSRRSSPVCQYLVVMSVVTKITMVNFNVRGVNRQSRWRKLLAGIIILASDKALSMTMRS